MLEDYDAIYSQDQNVDDKAYGWIQWKGTDVCMDLHCSCGAHEHIDMKFFYHYQCGSCGKRYAVGQNVLLIPLTEEQADRIEKELQPMTAFQRGRASFEC